jgi:CBS domain-containing protein
MMNEQISTILSTKVLTAHPDEKLSVAREAFKNRKIHHLPIVDDDGMLVGLITTSDLLWLNKQFSDYENVRLGDVMTTRLAKLEPTAKIGTAAEIFLRNWFHALPIVDAEGKLLGVVTTFDILKYNYQKEYPGDDFPFNW